MNAIPFYLYSFPKNLERRLDFIVPFYTSLIKSTFKVEMEVLYADCGKLFSIQTSRKMV